MPPTDWNQILPYINLNECIPPVTTDSNKHCKSKACYWICTSPRSEWEPCLPDNACYCKGQLEIGEGGYEHWQFIVYYKSQQRFGSIRKTLGKSVHIEPTRSTAAENYVWKSETAVAGTQFEFGTKSIKRQSATDWDRIREIAQGGLGDAAEIPSDIFIRCYGSLRNISKDFATPTFRGEQSVSVYWGTSGTGKSHRAFEECGESFYLKSPLTKWWDGYRGEENIIIDEFRGVVDISHVLKWLDKYPCLVEVKGSQVPLKSKKWWITSNLSPDEWYPNLDTETKNALTRRLSSIEHFNTKFGQ